MSLLPPLPDEIDIHPGPALLDGLERGPGLAAHRQQYDEPRASSLPELQALVEAVGLRGRGGAASLSAWPHWALHSVPAWSCCPTRSPPTSTAAAR